MSKKKWNKSLNALLASTLVASVSIPVMPAQAVAAGPAADLIISEYIEGSSNNKAIELYNGTGSTIDLSQYKLELYTNGGTTPTNKQTLSGTLAHNDTIIIYNSSAVAAIKDKGGLPSAVTSFNGNDAIVLKKGEEVIDSFGQMGFDPGKAWDVNGVSTVDKTLVRKSAVTSGDINPSDVFDPSLEWQQYPIDTFDHLGSHSMDGGEVGPITKAEAVTASTPSGTVATGTAIALASATEGATIYYTTDGTEPTVESAVYSQPIIIDKTTTLKAIAVADGLENSDVQTYSYTVSGQADVLSIANARTEANGTTVTIKGIVAGKLKNTISVQDGTGGIAVRPSSLNVEIGDEVTLKGKLADYRGLLQLDAAQIIDKVAGVGAPTAKVVTGAEVGEANESQLVTVKNVTLTNAQTGSGWANFTASDGSNFLVRDETATLGLTAGTTYESITGIVQQFDNDYQVIPRSVNDIVVDSTALKPAIASPGSGTFVGKTTVTLSTSTANGEIYFTVDGSDPTVGGTKYTTPIDITANTTLKTVVKASDGTFSEVMTYDYNITDALQIHDIQGEGHASPYAGKTIEGIEGIVTYSFSLNGSYYYTIQTPDELADNNPNTSEGILLYSGKNAWPIQVGNLVSVKGKVDEYAYDGYSDANQTDLKTTQINVRNDQGGKVEVLKSSVALPKAIQIDKLKMSFSQIDSDNLQVFNPTIDAIDFWESIEGMRVEVGNVKAVGPQEHGDLVTVLESEPTNTLHGGVLYEEGKTNPNRIQFRLEPNGTARDFEVATGDKFNGPITGIVGYSYQNFKIYVPLDQMKQAHVKGSATPETTKIVKAEDKVTIASYNLENFSNNKTSTTDEKARKLARAIAIDMQTPDIVGVTEVQDNNGESAGDSKADQSYQRLIDAIKAASGVEYKFVNIDPVNNADGGAPNANIRVGFLYNPARVNLKEGSPAGDATTAVGYQDGQLTLNPGRIDPTNEAFNNSRKPLAAQFEFQGADVIVIANHWNSKSGDTPLFGSIQPPQYKSEVQRQKIANIVYGFVNDIKTKNPDANVVSLGDFNDYQFAAPLKIHEGELMTNMINKAEDADRYTYLYQGNSQVLDHILVSNNLKDKTLIDILHINADFTDMAGRASDHDPVMVQVDLKKGSTVEPIVPEITYYYENFKKNILNITKPSVALHLDAASHITKGVHLKGKYVELHGEGFKTTDVIITPNHPGSIVDLKGNTFKKITIEGKNVSEIRGADNIDFKLIELTKGATLESIKFTNSKGDIIVPFENKQPIVKSPIANKTVAVGTAITIDLTEHFADPDNDKLTFTATKGSINGNILTLNLEAGSHIVGVTASDGKKSVTTNFSVSVTVTGNDYYASAYDKEGLALKKALHDIISNQKVLSYDDAWDALRYTDEDPNNVNNVLLFYSGKSSPKTNNGGNVGNWNREHTWAKSHGNFGTSNGPGTDIHHLRPTDVQVNSARGNLDFDNGGSPVSGCNGCLKDSDSFEPPNNVKGDVARILFYMATRYESGDRVDLELNEKVNNGTAPYHGKLSILLQWHQQDPVDDYEKRRNDRIYEVQGNRNPFIDHPEWVETIYGKKTALQMVN
ncbi:endonuclease [Lysinibacillus sp. JNUCC-52]|uniref:endonuclease n=1 Tax=Lysinibacillus sp. JNUCC-52 TaxID=2792480 RepID=UPI0019373393|nr:endonuclease [Lysinibacillus sp. JNUCC-52]